MRKSKFVLCIGILVSLTACNKSPSGPSVSFTSPLASGPSAGSTYRFSQQPITLTIANAVRTAPATATYSVEVASDAAFANKVFSRDGIAEGSGGTTSVQLAMLGGNATYHWRWRTIVDGVTGSPSPVQSFFVQPQIVINAPGLNAPGTGSTVAAQRPTFVIANASRTGPAGTIFYEFQVSTSASFSPLVASATVQEQTSNTSWTPSVDLPAGDYFWRARATDPANNEASAYAGAAQFTLTAFSMKMAIITNSPPGMADWPETTKITYLEFRGGSEADAGIRVEFSKKDGPGRWPDVFPPGWSGPLQYCLGMVLKINGQYYADAPVQMWNGREWGGGAPSKFAQNWFYDSRWGPMKGYQPAVGETIGIFVAAGVTRDKGHGTGDLSPVKERSNVVFVPMPTDAGAVYRF